MSIPSPLRAGSVCAPSVRPRHRTGAVPLPPAMPSGIPYRTHAGAVWGYRSHAPGPGCKRRPSVLSDSHFSSSSPGDGMCSHIHPPGKAQYITLRVEKRAAASNFSGAAVYRKRLPPRSAVKDHAEDAPRTAAPIKAALQSQSKGSPLPSSVDIYALTRRSIKFSFIFTTPFCPWTLFLKQSRSFSYYNQQYANTTLQFLTT